jgi:alpha-D-glucose phosphate-specific phosphoglucomutase
MPEIKFGTEGWRAIMAEEFTADNVRRVAQAVAEHILSVAGDGGVAMAVGYDTRFLSEHFAVAVAEVFAANGIRTALSDRKVPTCALSRYVVEHQQASGIMITASHNPPLYNGVKIKEAFGGSAVPETVASVEQRLPGIAVKRLAYDEALSKGLITRVNMEPDYLAGLRRSVTLATIKRARLKVAVDSMHGAGDSLIERLLKGGRCRVTTLHAAPDPWFGGHAPEPIAKHLTELSRHVRATKSHLGIANDGDADRIGLVGPDGAFINPGMILCVLLEHLMTSRKWTGTVVKTVSNTSMIDRMTSALGLELIETAVGFKHIAKRMLDGNVIIGGEESGGIGVRGYLPERDGVFIGLLVLEAMAEQGKTFVEILRDLQRRYGRWSYDRRDLTVPLDRITRFFETVSKNPPTSLAGVPVAKVNTVDGIKLIDRDQSWLLFRRSGTEPIVRVYAESLSTKRIKALLDEGERLIQSV